MSSFFMITEPPLWLVLISSSFFALLTRSKAIREKRAPLFWFFIGFFFGLLGLIAFYLTKKSSKAPIEIKPPEKLSTLEPKLAVGAWYYGLEGQIYGPVSSEMILKLYQNQTLQQETLVWQESLAEWTKLENFIK